jgi:hypothetical protein
MIGYINHRGEPDEISRAEVEEIMRFYPYREAQWREHPRLKDLVKSMEKRPGKVPEGVRPVEPVRARVNPSPKSRPFSLDQMKRGLIHCAAGNKTLCHKHLNGMLSRTRFRAALNHPRVCPSCATRYLNSPHKGTFWGPWEIKELMAAWPHLHQREALCERLGRTMDGCAHQWERQRRLAME